jgi:hypothetical protein
MQLTELVEAIDFLRKAGWTVEPPTRRWTVEPPTRRSTRASLIAEPKRRSPKKGRRKRGRPRKNQNESSTA